MTSNTMDAVLTNPRIPTLPVVAVDVLQLTREPCVDLKQVADIVQNDQALAIKIVRTVNSSYYGLAAPCSTIRQSIIYLGLNAVKGLVLGFSLVESVDGASENDVGFDFVDYWRRAMYSAAAARELATLSQTCDPEEAFLASLIQDMGMVALFRTFGDVYLQVIDLTKGNHRGLAEVEQRSLRMDHAEVGAALASQWKLPQTLVEAIRHHHSAESATEESRPLVRCVELATDFTSAASLGELPEEIYTRVKEWLNLDPSVIDELLPQLGEVVAELSRLYQVDIGEKFDPNSIMSQAEDARVEHEVSLTRQLDELAAREANAAAACGVYDARQRKRDELLVKVGCAFEDAISSRASFALVLIEICNLADLGSSHGADAVDALTDHVGSLLVSQFATASDPGKVVRLENGQFGIVLPNADRRQSARKAESLRRQIESEPPDGEKIEGVPGDFPIGVSIGVAAVEHALQAALDSAPSMLRIAEQALKAATDAGGNCVRVFSPETRTKAAA